MLKLIDMKKETFIAAAGSVMLLAAYLAAFDSIKTSSPLVLLIITGVGLIVSLRFELIGYALLLCCGLALVVHPFLFSSTYWLLPGATLIGYTGHTGLISWWKNDQ